MSDLQPSVEFEDQVRQAVRPPDADPEFVRRLRAELASRPARSHPRFALRPAWAFIAIMAVVIAAASLPGVAQAVRQWFAFVPGIGLVQPNAPARMLDVPAAVTRDGITLTVEHLLVYADRTELAYRVEGLAPAPAVSGGEVCSGAEMYPRLRLPDGSVLAADPMGLGGARKASGYTAGHSFSSGIPAGVSRLTFELTCLQDAPRGAAPEEWSLELRLVAIPEGTQVGQPLTGAETAAVEQQAGTGINFDFLGGARQEDGYHFFFRFSAQDSHPDFLAARPRSMYLLDSSGARIELINARPWSPFDRVDVWEYRAVLPPASGEMTLVVDGAELFYLGQHASFVFAPGAGAPVGQTWEIGQRFNIGGRDFLVERAEKIALEGREGFQFTVAAGSAQEEISVDLIDMHSAPEYSVWSTTGDSGLAQRVTAGFVYEGGVPETLTVTFNTVSVAADGTWRLRWSAPETP